jgi:transposase
MNVRYRVELNQCERDQLTALLSGGKHGARKLKRAQILLAADRGASDEEIARSIGLGGSTVYRTKRRFVLGNLAAALNEEPRPGARRKLTGKEEALLVATACSSPPAGRSRLTLELLAGELARLTTHRSVSRETVRRRLAENDLKPWRKDMWCIPQVDAEYVARMEDVFDLYAESPDPNRPVVCFDFARQSRPSRANLSATLHQSVRVRRRPSALAQGESHREPARSRFRRLHARACRHSLSQGHAYPCRSRQSVDPLARRALPGVPG